MKKRKFTSAFKTKVVIEALKERLTLADVSQKFDITPQQISTWKREFLNNADKILRNRGRVKGRNKKNMLIDC